MCRKQLCNFAFSRRAVNALICRHNVTQTMWNMKNIDLLGKELALGLQCVTKNESIKVLCKIIKEDELG